MTFRDEGKSLAIYYLAFLTVTTIMITLNGQTNGYSRNGYSNLDMADYLDSFPANKFNSERLNRLE